MTKVLFKRMPASCTNLISDIKSEKYKDWWTAEERLLDMEASLGEKVEPRGRTYRVEVGNSDSKTKIRRVETQEVDPSTLSSTELATYSAR